MYTEEIGMFLIREKRNLNPTVILAMGAGKAAATAIDEYLNGK